MKLTALGPVAGAYYLDNSRVSCIIGPVGSGKSTGSCLRLQRHGYEQRPQSDGIARTRFAIVRNTKRQLQDTTLKTWLQIFPEREYGPYERTIQTHRWRFRPQGYDYSIDSEFIFRALDDEADVANLLSLEVTGFYFNEVREIAEPIIAHAGRRAGRYPPQSDGGCEWAGWIGDTNPWDTEHFLHDRFIENPREGWRHFIQPGGMEPDAENLENLPGGRQYYIDALADYTQEDANVYVHAKWGITKAGKPIYTDYVDSLHCRPFELLRGVPLSIGLDFGRTPAAAIAQNTPMGWRVRHELCAVDMGVKQFGEELKKFVAERCAGYEIGLVTGDPAGNERDARDETVFDILKGVGIEARPASTNDPTVRIEAVNGALRRLTRGQPSLLIHPDCKILRRACIDGYHYRKLKVVGQRYDDKPDKNQYSHIAEALQYLLLGGGEGRQVFNKGPRSGTRPRYAQM